MNIFNFFRRKTTLLTLKSDENAILFTIDKNNKLSIRVSAQLLDEKNSQKMAEVLFLIGKDFYRPLITKMLENMAIEDESRKDFVKDVTSYWEAYLDTYKKETYNTLGDEPVVSPLKFSQLVTNIEK
jgi:uncharacterized protein YjgD (DUF1641 family)